MTNQLEVAAPNLSDMVRHLQWLARPIIPAAIDARIEIAWCDPESGPNRARTYSLNELSEAATFAAWINQKGCNVYVGATLKHPSTPFKGRTTRKHTYATTCLPIDIDGDFIIGARKLGTLARPKLLVVTGRLPELRGQLWIRLNTSNDLALWDKLNSATVHYCGGDKDALGTYRLMRLAGSVSYPPARKRQRGYVTEQTTLHVLQAPKYDVVDLLRKFPDVCKGGTKQPRPQPTQPVKSALPLSSANVARIVSILDSLPDRFVLEYDLWIKVGFALHDFDSGNVGLNLWISFSHRCPDKAASTNFERRWSSFGRPDERNKITLRWLFASARDFGQKRCG